MTPSDLVIVMLLGVQQFVAQSRSTGDAAASSRIVSRLADGMRAAAAPLGVEGTEIIFPAPIEASGQANADSSFSLPNRVVFQVKPGTGVQVAKRVAAAAGQMWRAICRDTLRGTGTESLQQRLVDESIGFPSPWWVVVPPYDQRGGQRRLRVWSLTAQWAADITSYASSATHTRMSTPALMKRAYASHLAPREGTKARREVSSW